MFSGSVASDAIGHLEDALWTHEMGCGASETSSGKCPSVQFLDSVPLTLPLSTRADSWKL